MKSPGFVGENFDMDDYVDVDFDIRVNESSSLNDKETLIAVCNAEE